MHEIPAALRALALAALVEGQYQQAVGAWARTGGGQAMEALQGS